MNISSKPFYANFDFIAYVRHTYIIYRRNTIRDKYRIREICINIYIEFLEHEVNKKNYVLNTKKKKDELLFCFSFRLAIDYSILTFYIIIMNKIKFPEKILDVHPGGVHSSYRLLKAKKNSLHNYKNNGGR